MTQKTEQNSFQAFFDLVQAHQRFAVISHFRPDGDAIGSTLALGLALQERGKEVTFWNNDPAPKRYAFLEGIGMLQPVPETLPGDIEVLICVDTGDWKRLGDHAAALLQDFPCKVNIDHHETNKRYAHLNIVDDNGPATGFVIYKLLKAWGSTITPAIANALYAAISTDTGSFQFSSTTPDTMCAAAELIGCGVDVGDINRRLYQEQPLTAFTVQKEVLNNMVVECNGMLSHYSMPAGTKQKLHLGLEDTKDLVDIIRPLEGVKVAIIFEDTEDGRIRMSLRSKDPQVSVSQIATQFGGGGHAMAAGIRMRGGLAACREQVLNATRQLLATLPH